MGEEATKVKNTGNEGWRTKLEGAGNGVMGREQRKDGWDGARGQMNKTRPDDKCKERR